MKLKRRTVKYLQRKRFEKDKKKLFKLFFTALSGTPKMDGSERNIKELLK